MITGLQFITRAKMLLLISGELASANQSVGGRARTVLYLRLVSTNQCLRRRAQGKGPSDAIARCVPDCLRDVRRASFSLRESTLLLRLQPERFRFGMELMREKRCGKSSTDKYSFARCNFLTSRKKNGLLCQWITGELYREKAGSRGIFCSCISQYHSR